MQYFVVWTKIDFPVMFLAHIADLSENTQTYYKIYSLLLPIYRGADKSLARPTSSYILCDGENILFDASLVIYINSTNIPPIMIINMIYKTQNLLSL
jgi:hypothetical protein